MLEIPRPSSVFCLFCLVQFSPYHMPQNNYAFWWLWTWLSFTWNPADHITCHDAFCRFSMSQKFLQNFIWPSTTSCLYDTHINSLMRFKCVYVSLWKRKTNKFLCCCYGFSFLQKSRKHEFKPTKAPLLPHFTRKFPTKEYYIHWITPWEMYDRFAIINILKFYFQSWMKGMEDLKCQAICSHRTQPSI